MAGFMVEAVGVESTVDCIFNNLQIADGIKKYL
jgi:hypothetical protein